MFAILEDARSGDILVTEVPPPELKAGGILIGTSYSAISSGTERATLAVAEKSLLGKAMARPDLVRQVLDFARRNGLRAAYEKVQTRLEKFTPLGYSCAGTVIAVADGVREFKPGDRAACGGGGYANHAEINFVPRNLAVKVPDNVSLKAASLTTIGAIAMQGIRQANVTFGETVVVVGAGLVGLLAVQIAKAAGCRVIAMDIDESRTRRAVEMGAHLGVLSTDPRAVEIVKEFSRYGADAAVVTASSKSTAPAEMAASVLRDRGRISIVGDVGLGVSRHPMYMKELSLALSRSYGPGRYDPNYEEAGVDYPIGHVRWTERRNMEAFVDMLSSGAINVDPLVQNVYPVAEAARAYQDIMASRSYTSILEYPGRSLEQEVRERRAAIPGQFRASGKLSVGCIGAGGFATGVIFPALRGCGAVAMVSVATSSGTSAESARRNSGFQMCQTPSELLSDPQLDAAFVLSQHDSHARYVIEALRNGKSVFVEKPLATNRDELNEIVSLYESLPTNKPTALMVGFNRRFAPFTERVRTFFANRQEPMLIHVRVNAGYIPSEHWVQRPADGGRIVGEFCHFVDWARFVIGTPIKSVWATALPDGSRYSCDNISAVLSFGDGSIANLIYTANGDTSVPKEYFEVFCENAIARLTDFVSLDLIRNGKVESFKAKRDKGHKREMELTVSAMLNGHPAPIPLEQLVEVTEATFAIHDSISTGLPMRIPVGQSVAMP